MEQTQQEQQTSRQLEPHQQRVVEEKQQNDERLAKLTAFLDGPVFVRLDGAERARLTRQRRIMEELSEVLGERIAAF